MFPSPISNAVSERSDAYVASFVASTPVRYVVIDGFLDDAVAERLHGEFPKLDTMPKSRDYMFSDKRELSTLDRHSEASRALHAALTSHEFGAFLSALVQKSVFIDPEYVGGGFHAGGHGSFLDLHTDFNIHPGHSDWLRELNVLLYLNPSWEKMWGGELLLTDSPGRPGAAIAPLFNRLVIMESTDRSFHGYRPTAFPTGSERRSVAAYAYSFTTPGEVPRRTTHWRPEDPNLLKRLLARNWNWMVLTKNKFLGSGTAKNRRS